MVFTTLFLSSLVLHTALSALPTFITPRTGTSLRSVDENSPPGNSVLLVEGQDTDGDSLTYSIVSQNPSSPPFELNSTSGLFKTPAGLDAEITQHYTFTFGVSDGGAVVTSVDFIVNINDLNDNTPFFNQSVSTTVEEGVPIGTEIIKIAAYDNDITPAFNTIYYSITAGNTNNLFVISSSTGVIETMSTLTGYVGLHSLTIQAYDGSHFVSTTADIDVVFSTAAPVCASCTNVTDHQECKNDVVCGHGEVCYTTSFRVDSIPFFNFGCKKKNDCVDSSVSPISLVGRSLSGFGCSECCSQDHCNRDLCFLETQSGIVAFTVSGTSGLTVSGNLLFTNFIASVGGGYDLATGTFTCTVPGLYFFTLSLDSAGKYFVYCFIMKNGNGIVYADSGTSNAYTTATVSTHLLLSVNDTVSVGKCHLPEHISSDGVTFSGTLIS